MWPGFISYGALAIIIIVGIFIMRNAFKLNEKNYPLGQDEQVLYEEENIKLRIIIGSHIDQYSRIRIRITNKRMYIFSHGKYILTLIYLDSEPTDKTKQEFKGLVYIPRLAFKIEQDKKKERTILVMERQNFLGYTVRYVFFMSGVQDAAKALDIV